MTASIKARGRTVVLVLMGVELAVLAATGVALYFVYRPSAAQGWDDIAAQDTAVTFASAVRAVHRVDALALLLTVLAAVGLMAATRPWRRAVTAVVAVVVPAAAAGAYLTGLLLPWDQLALWAVTVGTNMDGYEVVRSSQVRFVLIGNREISPGTLLAWLGAHAALGTALAVAVLVALTATRRLSTGTGPVESHGETGDLGPV